MSSRALTLPYRRMTARSCLIQLDQTLLHIEGVRCTKDAKGGNWIQGDALSGGGIKLRLVPRAKPSIEIMQIMLGAGSTHIFVDCPDFSACFSGEPETMLQEAQVYASSLLYWHLWGILRPRKAGHNLLTLALQDAP